MKFSDGLRGVKACATDNIKELEYDFIIITTGYVDEVKKQLAMLEVENEKIKDFILFI